MNTETYKREELTINMLQAQLSVLIYFVPSIILFGLPYYFIWGDRLTMQSYRNMFVGLSSWTPALIFGIIVLGVILHEFIHGVTWAKFAKNGLKSIKYGVLWQFLTPYCHCEEPLLVKHYIIGAFMPGLVLGFFPSFIALITGSLSLILLGLFFIITASGDFMIINILRKESMDSLVQDHPKKIGCYIYKPTI